MSIISKKATGTITVIGLVLILTLNIVFFQSFATGVGLIFILFLINLFLYQPKWGFVLILFMRPLIDNFSGFSIFPSLSFDLNVPAFFGIIVIFLLSFFIFSQRKLLKKLPLKYLWIIFILIISLTTFSSINKIASFYEITRIISIFLFFITAFILTKEKRKPIFIIYGFIASSIIPFIIATYQLLTGSGLADSSGINSRIFATFSHSNSFASFALIIIALLFYLLITEKSKNKRFLWGMMTTWSLVLLIATYSRGAWLAILIFLLVLGLTKYIKIIFTVVVPIIIIFAFIPTINERIQDLYKAPITSSVTWRILQWERAYEMFIDKPLTGQGIGTELIAHEKYYGFYAGNRYAHNDFLRVALETGIFGFIVYFLLITVILKTLFVNFKKSHLKNIKTFNLIIFALFVAITSFSLSSNTLRETVTQWYLWSLIGISIAYSQNSKLKLRK
jgi:O-antigen ligase